MGKKDLATAPQESVTDQVCNITMGLVTDQAYVLTEAGVELKVRRVNGEAAEDSEE